jgi:hypothetical protein
LRQERFIADAFGLHEESSTRIQSSPGNFVAGGFFYGHGFACDHRFVDGAGAFKDCAVNRNALPWSHTQAVALLDEVERDIFFAAVRSEQVRLFRRQI